MTVNVKPVGELSPDAEEMLNRMWGKLVSDLRETFDQSIPTDDRLAEIEIQLQNLIFENMPNARMGAVW